MINTLKKIIPYIIVVIITIILSGIFSPKIDFLSNKEVKNLRKENVKLEKENETLLKSAREYQKSSERWENAANSLKDTIAIKEKELNINRKYNLIIREKIDSLNINLTISDSTLNKIDEKIYEEINDTSSYNVNEHYKFFTEWLNDRR